jgi:hypothetical protein
LNALIGDTLRFELKNTVNGSRMDVGTFFLDWGDGVIDAPTQTESYLYQQGRTLEHAYGAAGTYTLNFEWLGGYMRLSDGAWLRPDGESGTCNHEKVIIPVTVSAPKLEPGAMPIDGGLRFRVEATAPDLAATITVGGVPATDVAAGAGWIYATAPAMAVGSHDVKVQRAGNSTVVGTMAYVAQLLPSVDAAVQSYLVTLKELVQRRQAATNPDEAAHVVADRDMWANTVDTAIHTRAEATAASLEDPAVASRWLSQGAAITALAVQIRAPVIVV